MDNKRIVLLNGPPSSGKGVSARHACNKLGMVEAEFKQKLFEISIPVSMMSEEQWWEIYNNRTDPDRPNKETPLKRLGGLSQRQLLIRVSEEWMKPMHGPQVFGEAAVAFVNRAYNPTGRFIFSDSGFLEEVQPLIDACGKDNIMLVRLHRKGCSFEGDSRNYLPSEPFGLALDLFNNGTLEEFRNNVVNSIKWFVTS